MAMAIDKERIHTVEEFEDFIALPENQDRLFELINGEIVEKMPTQLHALIASLFNLFLGVYMQQNPIGWVFTELRIKLPDDEQNDTLPDVAVVLKENRKLDPDAPLTYMPDLAIEIQSPGQSEDGLRKKVAHYLANGTRLVWLTLPKKQAIEVHAPGQPVKTFGLDDTLDGGDVLPGFKLAVKDVFTE
jgi:Uma2 family endonuclease